MRDYKREYLNEFFKDNAQDDIFVIYHINTDAFLPRSNPADGIYFEKRNLLSFLSDIDLRNVSIYPINDDMKQDFRFPMMGTDLHAGVERINALMRKARKAMDNRVSPTAGFTPIPA